MDILVMVLIAAAVTFGIVKAVSKKPKQASSGGTGSGGKKDYPNEENPKK